MEDIDTIEPVDEPNDWVNELVIVEKPNGKSQICLLTFTSNRWVNVWVNCKPYFSNKHLKKVDNDIALNEDGELILKNIETANTLNDYFGSIVENLRTLGWRFQ